MKLKRFFEAIAMAVIFALAGWLAVSWVDVLLHNDPVYGDKQCDCDDDRAGGVRRRYI